jgi:hypothetical protein
MFLREKHLAPHSRVRPTAFGSSSAFVRGRALELPSLASAGLDQRLPVQRQNFYGCPATLRSSGDGSIA